MPRKRVRREQESIAELFGDVVQDRASYLYSLDSEADESLRLSREPAPRPDPANENVPAKPPPTGPIRAASARATAAPAPDADPGPAPEAPANAERLHRARLARARAGKAHDPAPRDALPEFEDDRGLWSAVTVVHGALAVLSLGLYRPWMKTETRRVIWSHVRVDGEPLEYLGTGAQLFRGLMIAATLLAVVFALAWTAAAAMGLMTLDLVEAALAQSGSALDSAAAAMAALAAAMAAPAAMAALLLAPLLPLAAFRGRRYRLSRTRWKGIRFGMDGSGWGMVGLGLLWLPLILGSAGLLWPVWRWMRERRLTRAMRWGEANFEFEGGPGPLMLHWLPPWGLVAGAATLVASPAARAAVGLGDPEAIAARMGPIALLCAALLAVLGMAMLLANYRAAEVRLTMGARRLAGARVECAFSVWHLVDSYLQVSRRNLWPGILVWALIAGVAAIPMWGAFGAEMENPAAGGLLDGLGEEVTQTLFHGFHSWRAQGLFLMAVAIDYFLSAVFALWLWTCVYQRRRTEHLLESITVVDVHRLDAVRGRARERGLEAEGLEDALDVFGF